jgi:hypothetical protein
MSPREYKYTEVTLSDIDLSDASFRISRPVMDERMSRIFERFGHLTVPLMIRDRKGFVLLTGHNSIEKGVHPERNSIWSMIIDEMDSEIYIRETLLMAARGEIGPLGKLKALAILKGYFRIDGSTLSEIGREGFQLPGDFLKESELTIKIEQAPSDLREYIERRDISFKIIRLLCRLSRESLGLLSDWVKVYNIRVNIFRDLAEMLFDLQRDGKLPAELFEPLPDEINDQRQHENYIYNRTYSLRYPEYSRLKEKADKLRSNLQSVSIEIEYPEYFERSSLRLIVGLHKGADINKIGGKLESLLKSSSFKELLDLI